jgi:hypothetical protein
MKPTNGSPACWLLTALISFIAAVASLSPASAQDDPLAVARPDAVYETVLTGKRVERKVMSWYNGWTARPKDMTDRTWANERRHILEESAAAGIDGPFAPGALSALGEKEMEALNRDFGMRFPFMAHAGSYWREAKNAGAKFIFGMGYVSGEYGRPAPWDPAYREASSRGIEKWLRENGKKPWLSCVLGFDEPLNYAGTSRTPGAVEIVNRGLREKYGVKIALTALDTTKAYFEWPTEPAILNKPQRDVAILRAAVWRWLNEQLRITAKREYDLVRTYAPGVEYHAYNRNAINIFDFINTNVRNSLDRVDQAALYDVTDSYSADPYPTGNLERDGRDRALYHVGFISKFITDLAGGKPSKTIMQAFKFSGRFPTLENLREWTSQAAKAGVTHLEWYGWPRSLNPELYREMLRMSRLWKDLPRLDIPARAEIAVIFSDDSRNAVNDAGMNAHYMLHVLLGEQLGAWFAFTGENQVRRGIQSLDSAKLIIAPQLSYISRPFAEALEARVRAGATLFVLDPDALDWDIETGSLASQRTALLGAPLGSSREASQLVPTDEGRKRFPGTGVLILHPGPGGVTARTLRVPKDATVLFTFGDGVPAVYSRRLGSGEVVVFAAQPFGGLPLGLRPMGWDALFAAECDRLSIARGLPIWRFLLPARGGETPTYEAPAQK